MPFQLFFNSGIFSYKINQISLEWLFQALTSSELEFKVKLLVIHYHTSIAIIQDKCYK